MRYQIKLAIKPMKSSDVRLSIIELCIMTEYVLIISSNPQTANPSADGSSSDSSLLITSMFLLHVILH